MPHNDNEILYLILLLVGIVGAIFFALGITNALNQKDFTFYITIGIVLIMISGAIAKFADINL